MELIDNGGIIEYTNLVSEVSKWFEARQGGNSIYNPYTKKRRRTRGVHTVSQRQPKGDTRRTNGSSGRDAENGGNDVKFSASDNENYTKESLTEPVTKIVKDFEKVKLRAELRNGKKVYSTKDAKIVLDSIMNNLTFRENHIFFGKKVYETNAKRLIFDYQFFLRIRFLVFVEYVV